jgi:L-iditol 2-dehydrogenase
MKSIVLTGIREMETREVPDPVITQPDQVLLKMERIGVCGSDVHYYASGRIGDQVVSYPFTVGHECSGTVMDAGAQAGFSVGERVAVDPAMPCYECSQCGIGRVHTCKHLRFLGCPGQAEGCLSEYLLMPARSCVKLPDAVSLEGGMLSEPLSIGVYAVSLAPVTEGRAAAVLGAGPIGLSVIAALRSAGAASITATEKLTPRLDAARRLGAAEVVDANQPPENRLQQLRPEGFDTVYECCGQQEAVDTALRVLTPGGTLMLIGIPAVDHIQLDMNLARRREIRVQNVRRQLDCVEPALRMIAADQSIEGMITHRFSLDDTARAFDLVDRYGDGVIKAMIEL